FSSRRRHTRSKRDWSSDVCSSDLKDIMSYLLGPATVAIAVPLYKQRKIIYKNLRSILIGIFLGTIVTIVSAVYMAKIFGLSDVRSEERRVGKESRCWWWWGSVGEN